MLESKSSMGVSVVDNTPFERETKGKTDASPSRESDSYNATHHAHLSGWPNKVLEFLLCHNGPCSLQKWSESPLKGIGHPPINQPGVD